MSSARVTFDAGLMVRGQARREIEAYAFRKDLGISIREIRGLIESTFMIELTGDDEKLRDAVDDINHWVSINS